MDKDELRTNTIEAILAATPLGALDKFVGASQKISSLISTLGTKITTSLPQAVDKDELELFHRSLEKLVTEYKATLPILQSLAKSPLTEKQIELLNSISEKTLNREQVSQEEAAEFSDVMDTLHSAVEELTDSNEEVTVSSKQMYEAYVNLLSDQRLSDKAQEEILTNLQQYVKSTGKTSSEISALLELNLQTSKKELVPLLNEVSGQLGDSEIKSTMKDLGVKFDKVVLTGKEIQDEFDKESESGTSFREAWKNAPGGISAGEAQKSAIELAIAATPLGAIDKVFGISDKLNAMTTTALKKLDLGTKLKSGVTAVKTKIFGGPSDTSSPEAMAKQFGMEVVKSEKKSTDKIVSKLDNLIKTQDKMYEVDLGQSHTFDAMANDLDMINEKPITKGSTGDKDEKGGGLLSLLTGGGGVKGLLGKLKLLVPIIGAIALPIIAIGSAIFGIQQAVQAFRGKDTIVGDLFGKLGTMITGKEQKAGWLGGMIYDTLHDEEGNFKVTKYISDFVQNDIVKPVTAGFNSFTQFVSSIPTIIGTKVKSAVDSLGAFVIELPNRLTEKLNLLVDGLGDFVTGLPDMLVEKVTGFMEKISSGFDNLWTWLESLPVIGKFFKGIKAASQVATKIVIAGGQAVAAGAKSAAAYASKGAEWVGQKLGVVAAKQETGTTNLSTAAATVSSGAGDAGGKSYGIFQLASKRGQVSKFLKESGYAQQFQGLEVGSKEFDQKWKQVASSDANFADAQMKFAQKSYYLPLLNKASNDLKFDLSKKGRAVQEAIMSTGVQYGPNSNVITQSLTGMDLAKASDADIVNAIQNKKAATISTKFKSSSLQVQAGVAARVERERKDLLALNTAAGGTGPSASQVAATPPSTSTKVVAPTPTPTTTTPIAQPIQVASVATPTPGIATPATTAPSPIPTTGTAAPVSTVTPAPARVLAPTPVVVAQSTPAPVNINTPKPEKPKAEKKTQIDDYGIALTNSLMFA